MNNILSGITLYPASAGAGKTTTIINLISEAKDEGIDTSRVLMLAFENSAKNTMISRLKKKGIKKKMMPTVKTVHSLAYMIVNENNRKKFKLLDDYEQYTKLSILLTQMSSYKNNKTTNYSAKHKPFYYINLFNMYNVHARDKSRCDMDRDAMIVFDEYEKLKLKNNYITYGDMLYYAYEILQNKAILKTYKNRFKYIIVDEFQDIGKCGFEIINLLQSNNGNLICVGDKKQSIFGSFAGSSVEYIVNFTDYYPDTTTKYLKKTYRTPKEILSIANNIAEDIGDRRILTENKSVGKIQYEQYETPRDEARKIINKIIDNKMSLEDTAILMRANSSSMWFQLACIENDIPFYCKKATFLEVSVIRTLVNYLSATFNNNYESLIEIMNKPNRYIKTSKISQVYKNTNNAQKALEIDNKAIQFQKDLQQIYAEVSLLPRDKRLVRALRAIVIRFKLFEYFEKEYENDFSEEIQDFITFLKGLESPEKLFKIVNEIAYNRKKMLGVRLLTMHASKGSEYDNVFVVSLNKGVLPHSNNMDQHEELRLFYVAVTRAKKNLYLSSTITKNGKISYPSCYIGQYITNDSNVKIMENI